MVMSRKRRENGRMEERRKTRMTAFDHVPHIDCSGG